MSTLVSVMATKKKAVEEKQKAGKHTKYNDDFPLLAEHYARQDLNDVQIAEKLGIKKTSLYLYQRKYPEFAAALKRGKAPVDAEIVNAFFKRAKGYKYTEKKIIRLTTPGEIKKAKEAGLEVKGIVIRVEETVKEVAPDVYAGWKLLCNRMPGWFRDKVELEHKIEKETLAALLQRDPFENKEDGKDE